MGVLNDFPGEGTCLVATPQLWALDLHHSLNINGGLQFVLTLSLLGGRNVIQVYSWMSWAILIPQLTLPKQIYHVCVGSAYKMSATICSCVSNDQVAFSDKDLPSTASLLFPPCPLPCSLPLSLPLILCKYKLNCSYFPSPTAESF